MYWISVVYVKIIKFYAVTFNYMNCRSVKKFRFANRERKKEVSGNYITVVVINVK